MDVGAFVGPSQVCPAGASGYVYAYRGLLEERIIAGDFQVLVACETTWELVQNVQADDLRNFRDAKRDERWRKRQLAMGPSTQQHEDECRSGGHIRCKRRRRPSVRRAAA